MSVLTSALKPGKSITISKAKKLADTWFSRYIRLRATDYKGYGNCITTGVRVHWKSADCGHFQSRSHLATRWHPLNASLQSKRANGPLGGMQYEHGKQLDIKHGKGTAEQMAALARTTVKFSIVDILDIAEKFRKLALEEASKRGITL